MILRMQEQGYNTVTRMAGRAFTYVSDFVMQTAIRVSLRDESYFTLKSIRDVVRWISHYFPVRDLFSVNRHARYSNLLHFFTIGKLS